MWDNDLQRAKDAIKRGDRQTARTILEMMPDNYIARDLLAKLNRKNLKFRHEKPHTPRLQSEGTSQKIPMPALIIIVLLMLFWAFFILGTAMLNPSNSQGQARAALVVAGALVVLPILYYLYWRWFWWALAGTWILITLGFVVAMAQGWQMPILF